MTNHSGQIRKAAPWIACIAVGIAAGTLLGVLIRDSFLGGATAEYSGYGLLADAARLEYENAPPTRALESVSGYADALEECRHRPKHRYPCEGIPLVRAYAMLAELNGKLGDADAESKSLANALRECATFLHRPCAVEDMKRYLPERRGVPVH